MNGDSDYFGTTVMLTAKGWIALAADALASAERTRNEKRRKTLCEPAINYLRFAVQS
jgi:hypothetical protein